MEFTIGRRLRRRGRGFLASGVAGMLAIGGWLAADGMPDDHTEPFLGLAFFALCGSLGGRELQRARRPFRLCIDAFGLTTHDMELSWEQIDTVALRYPPDLGDGEGTPSKPLLVMRPAAGTAVPRTPDRRFLGHSPRYTLVNTEDLDQSVAELGAVLAAFAGAHFETAPRAVRAPVPVTVAGPESRVPGGERVFLDRGRYRPWTLVWVVAALGCSAPVVVVLAGVGRRDCVACFAVCFVAALATWWAAGHCARRWHRPLRLRVGPAGLGMRDYGGAELLLPWAEIAAVTVGPLPDSAGPTRWLVVWPLPGSALASSRTHVFDGHQAYALVRLDRLPGGEAAVAPVVRSYAGERFSGARQE
ncbi:hypothetical protein SAMN05216223_11910 [Actinacidiphila yanglinensis]|uniref:PH domain-containing protein n=1 Tax=Actinacidiphila yanglinensis TaxID=310779 RepID=A0A1H6DUB9_9ACTN|nr:hypothetical protein [Actinacidiphila yanglinensis]SEG88185.1 hypothetical protein SAMN05216223_11910 [Actinacidiphila yanglinensis]